MKNFGRVLHPTSSTPFGLPLDTIRLEDRPLPIQGEYDSNSMDRIMRKFVLVKMGSSTGFFAPCSYAQISNNLQLRSESFSYGATFLVGDRNKCRAPGTLYNFNTMEEFHVADKQALLVKEAKQLWDDIHSGLAVQNSWLLNRFFILCFADLKKWRFYYWVAFPALVLQPPATCSLLLPASKFFGEEKERAILAACQSWRGSSLTTATPYFLLHMNGMTVKARPLQEWCKCQEEGGKVILGFYDPCHLPTNPGWPLRNFLILAAVQWGQKHVQVLSYREKRGQMDLDQCFIADVCIPESNVSRDSIPEAVGWEYGGMRMVDLASSMDPVRLAESAADLNLKLMRWRLLPSLDLDLLSKTKCLILGAGTLGCEVARGLLAWGIRFITFVDRGCVVMSKPIPPLSLFTVDDDGKMKAEAAAENLRRIFPSVRAGGVQLTIPELGRYLLESEVPEFAKACKVLQGLVDEHDVIFISTDTQESCWLPTLLCTNANKVAISAMLGANSFIVMRHGAMPNELEVDQKHETTRLGCLFCKHVASDGSTTCSNVASIAAAYAVELTVNLLHHPSKIYAPAVKPTSIEPLGMLPHGVRGFVSDFSQSIFKQASFSECVACSVDVISEYRRRGFDFLRHVFKSPLHLQELTGLTNQLALTDLYVNHPNKDLLSRTKCLLFGTGTLGCQVARCLLAKGINQITLVDNSRVTMSNPVRQSLYAYKDCLNGGKFKTDAAVETLKCISPSMDVKGIQLTIPMPGHRIPVNEEPEVAKTCKILDELVDKHDVIFLLTDTRESRWLPTLLCANANKIAINAALGFDTYLVMRHGVMPHIEDSGEGALRRLGCYFCNDVVAPEDSTMNRTLDQQCTVTRPGLARIAAALAVNLAIDILHHPAKGDAPATSSGDGCSTLPHQIRGCVANFSQQAYVSNAFNKCTACSNHVTYEYQQRGFEFLLRAFNSPTYLEELTGLTKLLAETNTVDIEWED